MIDFNELIDNYLEKKVFPRKIGRYWPSEAGGCLRKNYYNFVKPKEVEKPLSRIFEAGNRMHEFIADVIQSEKNKHVRLIDKELPIKIQKEDYLISGRIDDLIMVLVDRKKYLVEVKSTKYLPLEPREEHLMQLQLYMHSLGVHEGILLYIKKDDLQTKQFEINYDEEKTKKVISRFEKLNMHLKNKDLPKPEAKLDKEKNWMCAFCPYSKECENDGGYELKEEEEASSVEEPRDKRIPLA